MFKTQTLPENFIIQIKEHSSTLPPEVEQKINEVWEAEKTKREGKIFNGQVLSFVHFERGILEARVTDYRTYLAQVRLPNLYDQLKIRILAVSGLVAFGTDIIFGKRAAHVTQDAGMWELAPSGGLATDAVEEQFFEELNEELGLQRSMVASLRPFLFVEDTQSHVIDIGIDVKLCGSRSEINRALKRRSDEYSEISWVKTSEMNQFCSSERQRGGIVQTSLELLKAKKFIPS